MPIVWSDMRHKLGDYANQLLFGPLNDVYTTIDTLLVDILNNIIAANDFALTLKENSV